MYVALRCPQCEHPFTTPALAAGDAVKCPACDWSRSVAPESLTEGRPQQCLCCGNEDLWRQKNFPQWLGVMVVSCGAIISSYFYAYYLHVWALGTLMLVALLDMLLYIWMPDVLVCYRCQARHAGVNTEGSPAFSHELYEKYRQDAIRQKQLQS